MNTALNACIAQVPPAASNWTCSAEGYLPQPTTACAAETAAWYECLGY